MQRLHHDLLDLGLKTDAEVHPDFAAELSELRPPPRVYRDSQKLSATDYTEIARVERQRALYLGLSIIFLLVLAACLYLAQSQ